MVNRTKVPAEVAVHPGGGGKCCVDKTVYYYCGYFDFCSTSLAVAILTLRIVQLFFVAVFAF